MKLLFDLWRRHPHGVLFALLLLLCACCHVSVGKQVQSFETRPVDNRVTLGGTALFKCAVSARHGDVQWIHEGTALGYDRKVPGKPRYSVIWYDNEDTEYHLQIANVSLEDEGTFSCQVAPIGDWDTKLEARAKLTVLVAPIGAPEIMFNDESKNSNDLVYLRSASHKTAKFTCIVRRAKPVATVKWFLNGTLISSSLGKPNETKQPAAFDGLHEDLTSVFELKQQTNLVYNNSLIRCQVYHEAFGSSNTELQNMSIALRIIVVYAPSVPRIVGYSNSSGIVAGSELRLVCTSTYTYPQASLAWYRDDKLVSRAYSTIESNKTTEAVYKVARVSARDNRATLRCDAMNQAMDEPYSSQLTLDVLYGPEAIQMDGVFEVEVNKSISAVCHTQPANPAPRLKFFFDGSEHEPATFASTAASATDAAGAFIANATFSHVVRKEHNNKELKCFAENKAANVQQIVTRQIKVLYPPETLELLHSHDKSGAAVGSPVEGSKLRAVCVSQGGNPLPDIAWQMVGEAAKPLQLQPSSSQSIVYTIESALDLTLRREHHHQMLECTSSNKVGSLVKRLRLNVTYLPSEVHMSLVEPANLVSAANNNSISTVAVKAGTRVVLACHARRSNPQPTIAWFKDGYPMLLNVDEQQNLTSTLVAADKEYDTVSHMTFVVTSSDHLKDVRCDVGIRDVARTMHASLGLEVKFPPEIIKYPPSLIELVENTSFSLNLTARANPAPTYECSASNKKKYTVVNGSLTFVSDRSDNGEFVCSIKNAESTTDIYFKLNVKYAPSAKINSTLQTTSKGHKVQLFCLIEANPLSAAHITWKSNNKSLINSDTEQFYSYKFIAPNVSVLTIANPRDVDDGEMSCHVNNGVGGKTAVAVAELRVRRPPQIVSDASVLKAGEDSNLGHSAHFKCRSWAFPDVTFKWKTPNNVDISNSSKYSVTLVKISDQVSVSTMSVIGVTSADYGTYICEVRNELGSTFAKAVLSGKHQPEQPTDFRVTNITKSTISLAWRRGFDGGEVQRFRIRYRKDTIDPTYKYIETENDANAAVLDVLEPDTRYVINIQALNKFGTEGFLKEPLIVQTDFGFGPDGSIGNQQQLQQLFANNDFPLTIILIICGSGTLFMLFNVAFIMYLIRKRKIKGDSADSTTDTNETDANTVEMFSPPPPYPDELNYDFNLNSHSFEDENKPFVPQIHATLGSNSGAASHYAAHPSQQQLIAANRYLKDISDKMDYAIEYATPIHQACGVEQSEHDDDVYLSSLRQLDKSISAAIAGVSATKAQSQLGSNNNNYVASGYHGGASTIRSSFNPGSRLSFANRPYGVSTSFHQNLNSLCAFGNGDANAAALSGVDSARAFPYDRLSQARLACLNPTTTATGTTTGMAASSNTHINSNRNLNIPINSSSQMAHHLRSLKSAKTNSACRIYQDTAANEYSQHQQQRQQQLLTGDAKMPTVTPSSKVNDFKGHLV